MSDTPTSGEKFNHWAAGIVRLEQHGRFKQWVMGCNLLRALLILKLQVVIGELARRVCSRGHFGPQTTGESRRQVQTNTSRFTIQRGTIRQVKL